MDSSMESSLISKLQSSDFANIHHHFLSHLRPFSPFLNSKPTTTTTTTRKPNRSSSSSSSSSSIRSLAKQFLPFLNRVLSILPKILSVSSSDLETTSLRELFDTYRLCLDCLECVSSQLACKFYSIHLQRVRMVHCFVAQAMWREAVDESFSILQSLPAGLEGRYLPDLGKTGGGDQDFCGLVVEIVLSVVKCVSMSQSKEGREYRRVLDLVEELTPWFRVLDANTYEKLHRVLVSHLYRCTLFLVEELACFDGDLVCTFCAATLTEYAKSSMKDQTLKCGRRICSSLFSQKENGSSFVVGVLMCVLDTIAAECKVEMGNTFIEFVELVSYCANKCRITSKDLCTAVALHLNKMAGDFRQVLEPLNLILRLYATGLNFTGCNIQSSGSDSITSKSADDESAFEILLDDGDELQHLATSIGLLDNYFHINSKENKVSFSAEHKVTVGQICSHMESDYEASMAFAQKNGKAYLLLYLNALKFLCQPLAELVNLERVQIIAESEAISSSAKLCHIQNALHQFCDVFLFCHW
uniref:Separase n=1 Tax=Vitis vinifera TaxID=29760 RepID=F6H960_VITVI